MHGPAGGERVRKEEHIPRLISKGAYSQAHLHTLYGDEPGNSDLALQEKLAQREQRRLRFRKSPPVAPMDEQSR